MRGSVGCVGQIFTWVAWVREGENICYVDHNFYECCTCQFSSRGSLRVPNFLAWANFYLEDEIFLLCYN